jgi:hypothetical protein
MIAEITFVPTFISPKVQDLVSSPLAWELVTGFNLETKYNQIS